MLGGTYMSCYLCGSLESLTADHIPPKGFFAPPRPNLITVPCCASCNASYAKDDEAVRLWFSAPLGRSEAGEWIFEHKARAGTIARSAAFREKMLATMNDTELLTEDGEIEATSFAIPRDRVERLLFDGQRTSHHILSGLRLFDRDISRPVHRAASG